MAHSVVPSNALCPVHSCCSYVIPTPVIDHFLIDYKRNGDFTGFPALGVQWQRMESGALR